MMAATPSLSRAKRRQTLRRSTAALLLAGGAALTLAAGPASAATVNWTGSGGDANWDTPGNWEGGAVPGASDTANFNSQSAPDYPYTSGFTIDLNGDQAVGNLKSDYGSTNTDQLTIGGSGNTLTVNNGLLRGTFGYTQVNADVAFGADGTLASGGGTENLLNVQGNVGETGGSRAVTIDPLYRYVALHGDNTYTGATTIKPGFALFGGSSQTSGVTLMDTSDLLLIGDNPVGAGTVTVDGHANIGARGAAYRLDNDITLNADLDISGDGAHNGSATSGSLGLDIADTTLGGTVTLNADGLTITHGPGYNTNTTTITQGVAQSGGSRDLTIDAKDRDGQRIVLQGNNTYTGATVVQSSYQYGDHNGVAEFQGTSLTSSLTVGSGVAQLDLVNALLPSADVVLGTPTVTTDPQGDTNTWGLNLDFTGTQTIASLVIEGTPIAPGTTVGAGDYDYGSITGDGQLTVVPVPEPASLALLGLGGGLMMLRRRRRGD